MPRSRYACRWSDCELNFDNAEVLYDHLCDDHIGRKATNNLCLQCCWSNCDTKAAKRDHLTSHLRVHLPLKPHRCLTCKKPFKRPQDLKKHERIHTIEHKASLLSNQPGYKPVRRRRTTQQKPSNVARVSNPTLLAPAASQPDLRQRSTNSTEKDEDTDPGYFSEMLEGSSPSSYRGSANSSSSYHPTTDDDSDSAFITPRNKYTLKLEQGTISPEQNVINPLQNFLCDAMQTKTLSPDYDTEMMERLDGISHVMQRQPEGWMAPINDQSDINALQNWLEQLSANIQTDSCIYPELTSPQSSGLATSVGDNLNFDSDLYPSFNMYQQQPETMAPDWKTMMMTYSDNPLAACLLEQNKSIPLPPSINSDQTLSTTDNGQSTLAASFWTPGKSPDVEVQPIEDAVQSEAIEFDTPAMVQSKPQPIHMFESSKDEAKLNSDQKKLSYAEKRNMIHMMNVFTAPGQERSAKEQESNSDSVVPQTTLSEEGTSVDAKPEKVEPSVLDEDEEPSDPIAKLLFSRITDESSESCCLKPKQPKEKESPSPYAELADKLRDLTFNDTPAEERARRRHAAIVDRLWEAVLRIKRANLDKQQKTDSLRKPSSSRLRNTRHSSNTTRLVSV